MIALNTSGLPEGPLVFHRPDTGQGTRAQPRLKPGLARPAPSDYGLREGAVPAGPDGAGMVGDILNGLDGLPADRLALCSAIVFLAAVLRGYTGFGFALAAVPMLALIIKPVMVVPLVLCLEIVASILILPGMRHEVHVRSVAWLALGSVAGVPLGIYGLATQSDDVMRLVIAVIVLLSVAAIGGGLRLARQPGAGATVAVGAVSGLLNGATAMAGPPVILFYLGAGTAAPVGRASLVFYFSLVDTVAIAMAAAAGLLDRVLMAVVLVSLPALAVGQAIGARLFRSSLQRHYRAVAITVLATVSLVALAQSGLALWRG